MGLRKYARRECGFRMLAVKYSTKRVTASSPASVMIDGSLASFVDGREGLSAPGTITSVEPPDITTISDIGRERSL
jgi:hypothetical protein